MPQNQNGSKGIPKILIVDDEPVFCKPAKRILEGKQYEVDVAYTGEEAIGKIYDFMPVVVILDVKMPRLTGDELVKMIKAWKPEIQVIMVSAMATKELKTDCLKNGAFDFLDKPVDFGLLSKKIQEAISSGE